MFCGNVKLNVEQPSGFTTPKKNKPKKSHNGCEFDKTIAQIQCDQPTGQHTNYTLKLQNV